MASIRKQFRIILNNEFLKPFSTSERIEFLKLCHRRTYSQGEFVYHQGDPGTGMFFIEEGTVSLIVEERPGSDSPYTLQIKEPSYFGLVPSSSDFRRKSSARCLTDCVLYGFFQPDFESLRKRHPKIATTFLESANTVLFKRLDAITDALAREVGTESAFKLNLEQVPSSAGEPVE